MSKLKGKAKARARAKAKKVAVNTTLPKSSLTMNDKKKQIVEQLNNPKLGFEVLSHWKYGKQETLIYTPNFDILDDMSEKEYSDHLSVYVDAFGGVESAIYNIMHMSEHAGAKNPFGNHNTYEPFEGGAYKLNITVFINDGVINMFPMIQDSWELKEKEFKTPYGDRTKTLDPIFSQLARANCSTVFISPFNTNQEKNLNDMLSSYPFMRTTELVKDNWRNMYDASYRSSFSLLASESEGLEWIKGTQPSSQNKTDYYSVMN